MLHIALYHPAIPQNAGNLARTSVGFATHLHFIGPMSFQVTDHAIRRAGLDYWPHVRLTEHPNDEAFLAWLGARRPWLITRYGDHRFYQANYTIDDVMILGNENTGIPDEWHERWPDRRLTIPILGPIRSFNVANAGAIVLSQAAMKTTTAL